MQKLPYNVDQKFRRLGENTVYKISSAHPDYAGPGLHRYYGWAPGYGSVGVYHDEVIITSDPLSNCRGWAERTFYVASRVENISQVRIVQHELTSRGMRLLYDWTTHGSLASASNEDITRAVLAETDAAKSAKLLVVLLPGGRGTHSELGLALGGAAEHVVLVGEADFCLFYKHPKVTQITGPDWMVKLAELANEV